MVSAALGLFAGNGVENLTIGSQRESTTLPPLDTSISQHQESPDSSSGSATKVVDLFPVDQGFDLPLSQEERIEVVCEIYRRLKSERSSLELSVLVRSISREDFFSVVNTFLSEGEDCESLITAYALKEFGASPLEFDPEEFLRACGGNDEASKRLVNIYLPSLEENVAESHLLFNKPEYSNLQENLNINNSSAYIQDDPDLVLDVCLTSNELQDADEILNRLVRLKPSVVSERLNTLSADDRAPLKLLLVDHLIRHEPSLLLNEVDQGRIQELSERQTMRLFESWAESDILAAASATQNLPESLDNDWALRGLINIIAKHDQESAKQWLNLVEKDSLREALTNEILGKQ